ncbi:MAG: carbon monoxide dehydrogenase subunit G [Thermogemmatispora sp.]|uniref:CoxG family protein n=1 Tax=Thermogemmatispora sp. TaxID=1968838 RepID=UPI00261FA52F|nr:carbon monoxide dehydrogenase subunit G [Thermogemmatispora sp.]MBX5455570.1 carbon monoxide dehydrogenase subunit G [Thermogemmatispora sp.]
MDVEGAYTLQATPEEVWKCLMDQQILRQALPGVEHLEALDENRYAIRLAVRHAPLRGSYEGMVTISDQDYPHCYRIAVEGESRHGPVRGEGWVRLLRREHNTVVSYQGVLQVGRTGLLPAPVLRGTTKMLIQQFFLGLADQLRAMRPPEIEEAAESAAQPDQVSAQHQERAWSPEIVNAAGSGLQARGRTPLHSLVRRLHLGGGDPRAEERWVQTIRRTAMLAVLLLLVWVGTRLPRR